MLQLSFSPAEESSEQQQPIDFDMEEARIRRASSAMDFLCHADPTHCHVGNSLHYF
jgi:hypothetical protein